MGFNTTVLFLNDAVHLLTEDKEFPEKLFFAILSVGAHNPSKPVDVPLLNHVNAVQVLGCAHADTEQVFAIGGNTGSLLGSGSCYNSEHVLLRALAAQHGFRLVKEHVGAKKSHSLHCKDCRKNAYYGSCYDCGHILDDKGVCTKKCGGRR